MSEFGGLPTGRRRKAKGLGVWPVLLIVAVLGAALAGVVYWRGLPSDDQKLTQQAEALAAESRQGLSADTYAFNAEYLPIQWVPLLTPPGVAHDNSLTDVKAKLAQMHGLAAKYRAKGLARDAAIRARLAKLGSTPQANDKATALYEHAMGGTVALEARYWSMWDKAMADGEWIIAMLDRSRGDWGASRMTLTLWGRADKAGYDSHLNDLQTVVYQMNAVAAALATPATPIPVKAGT